MGDGTSQEHGTCLMDAKMKRIQNICNVRTQDTLDNFGKGVRDDVITNSFAMQEYYLGIPVTHLLQCELLTHIQNQLLRVEILLVRI